MAQIPTLVRDESIAPARYDTANVAGVTRELGNAMIESSRQAGAELGVVAQGLERVAAFAEKRQEEKDRTEFETQRTRFLMSMDEEDRQAVEKLEGFGDGYRDQRMDNFRFKAEESFTNSVPTRFRETAKQWVEQETLRRSNVYATAEVAHRNAHASKLADEQLQYHQRRVLEAPDAATAMQSEEEMRQYILNLPITTAAKEAMLEKSKSTLYSRETMEQIGRRNLQVATALNAQSSGFADQGWKIILGIENASGDPNAVSSAGAVGLAQVMPGTAKKHIPEIRNMTDEQATAWLKANPQRALEAGRAEYAELTVRYTDRQTGLVDMESVIIGYNAGPGVADRFRESGRDRSILPKETQNYIEKFKARFLEIGQDPGRGRSTSQVYNARTGSTIAAAPGKMITKADGWRGQFYSWEDLRNDGVAGGEGQIDSRLALILENSAAALGKKIPVSSAFRSSAYNAKIGGAGDSQHSHGNAIDLDVSGLSPVERDKIVAEAVRSGAQGIGFYDNGSIHIDVRAKQGGGPGGTTIWYNHGKDKKDPSQIPASFRAAIEAGVAARQTGGPATLAPQAGDEVRAPVQSGPVSQPFTFPAAPDAMDPTVQAATPAGQLLRDLPQDPGEFRKIRPGERVEDFVKLRDAHNKSRQGIIDIRQKAQAGALSDAIQIQEQSLAEQRRRLLDGIFSGQYDQGDFQRAREAGLFTSDNQLVEAARVFGERQKAINAAAKNENDRIAAERSAQIDQTITQARLGRYSQDQADKELEGGRLTIDEHKKISDAVSFANSRRDEGSRAFDSIVRGNRRISAADPGDRKAMDRAYDHATDPRALGLTPAVAAAAMMRTTGVLPDAYLQQIEQRILNGEAGALSELSRLLDSDPNAISRGVANIDNTSNKLGGRDNLLRAMTFFRGRTDLTENERAARIMKFNDPAFRQEVANRMEKGDLKQVLETAASARPADIAQQVVGTFFEPTVAGGPTRALDAAMTNRLKADYMTIFRQELSVTGDAEIAKRQTEIALGATYGTTEFATGGSDWFGGSVTRHPAEKVSGLPADEIRKQVTEEAAAAGIKINSSKIMLVPKRGLDRPGIPPRDMLPKVQYDVYTRNGSTWISTGRTWSPKPQTNPTPDR